MMLHILFDSGDLITYLRCMNREKMVYVRRVFCVLRGRLLTSAVSQGADADDFHPDRFIDADSQVTPAIADTKDGPSVIWHEILPFINLLAFRFEKVIGSLYPVT